MPRPPEPDFEVSEEEENDDEVEDGKLCGCDRGVVCKWKNYKAFLFCVRISMIVILMFSNMYLAAGKFIVRQLNF